MVRNVFLPEALRMKQTFFAEEILFDQYFNHLEALERRQVHPGIVESTYTEYFIDCSKYFDLVAKQIEGLPNKPAKVKRVLNKFKRSSARVGALRVESAIINLEQCVPRRDYLECQVAFRQMKREFQSLKNNLETYFEMVYRFPIVG